MRGEKDLKFLFDQKIFTRRKQARFLRSFPFVRIVCTSIIPSPLYRWYYFRFHDSRSYPLYRWRRNANIKYGIEDKSIVSYIAIVIIIYIGSLFGLDSNSKHAY